jgi:predicted RNA-binding protein YlxR (DUF448 family)
MTRGARLSRVKAPRERRCVATGEVLHESRLLRVALAPDNTLVPDIAAKLPGRGGWVSADRASVELAVRKRLFNRAFEGPVDAPADLADQFERLIEQRALSLLGLARRAGRLAMGYDAVRIAVPPAWRIEAADGAEDGRRKIDQLARAMELAVPVAGCFSAEALGAAVGRTGMVHMALAAGPEADGFAAALMKLSGFRAIDPRGAGTETQ